MPEAPEVTSVKFIEGLSEVKEAHNSFLELRLPESPKSIRSETPGFAA